MFGQINTLTTFNILEYYLKNLGSCLCCCKCPCSSDNANVYADADADAEL